MVGYGVSQLTHEIMHALPKIHSHDHHHDHQIKDHHTIFNQLEEAEQESSGDLVQLTLLTLASFVNATDYIKYKRSVTIQSQGFYLVGQPQHNPKIPHLPPLA